MPVSIPEEVLDWAATSAAEVDAGRAHPRDLFPALAEAGLIALGAPANRDAGLAQQAAVVEALARRSLSPAFALWGHRMSIEYLATAGTDSADALLGELRSGHTPGVSGMASGFKNFVGAGDLDLSLERDGAGGYRLSGSLPWASNLYSDAVVISAAYAPEDTADDVGERQRVIVVFRLAQEGVTVGRDLNLLALQGTVSTYVTLDSVAITEEQVLSWAFRDFLRQCRPSFAILQTSFCLGLATESHARTEQKLTGVNAVFAEDHQDLGRRLSGARQRVCDYAQLVGGEQCSAQDVLSLRLTSGRLATESAALEVKTAGGKADSVDSDVNRRYREATFIPVQSPSEAQLRWELSEGR